MIPRDCHGPLRGLAMTSLTAGSMREGFLQSFPNREARKKSARADGESFLSSRGLESAGVLCVLQAFQTDGSAEKLRQLPQRISSEFSQQGSSEEISKSGGREIFRRVEVWKAQAYFVYSKPSKPMNWQKISGICRREFLQSFPTGKLRRNQQERRARDFSSSRGSGNAGILCVFQVPRTDGSAEKLRHPPQMIFSELPNTKERGAAIAETE